MIQSLFRSIGWGMMTILAAILTYMTLLYFSFEDINFLLAKADIAHHPVWRKVFYIHIVGGVTALIVGPFQFLKGFRTRFLKLHRSLGKAYVAAILFIGGPSGMYMAFFAEGGFWGALGFAILSILWLGSTYMAYRRVRQGDIQAHQQWMYRSYAITFAAVTLRLWVPICSLILNMQPETVVILTAWLSWIPNILFTELFIIRWKDLQMLFRTQTLGLMPPN